MSRLLTKLPSLEKRGGGSQELSQSSQVHKVINRHKGGGSGEVGIISLVLSCSSFEGFPKLNMLHLGNVPKFTKFSNFYHVRVLKASLS